MSRKREAPQPVMVDGIPRPDLDHRLVTGRLMAFYLGVGPVTLWRWTTQGRYTTDQVETSGKLRPNYYYRPNRICPAKPETLAANAQKHQPTTEE